MFKRLFALYRRYSAAHLMATGGGIRISDGNDQTLGAVDTINLTEGRLLVTGWAQAQTVILSFGDAQITGTPELPRSDVAAIIGGSSNVGFELELLRTSDATDLTSPIICLLSKTPGATPIVRALPLPGLARARLLVLARFIRDGVKITPSVLGWVFTKDPKYRARVKSGLRLNTATRAGPMETRLFLSSGDPVAPLEQTPITIILPVYNAFELLEEVLTRVREHTDLPWRLLLIEDCSSDARVRPFLRDWAKEQNRPEHITLIENAQNKGFIGSVNDGLERALALGDHVVLLNSDAFVPQGWASRLLRPILAHDSIASVTPMSNDAEIFSVPAICTRTVLEPGQGDAIDGVANQFHPEATVSATPTGVGFCMAMNVDYIRKLPQFDLSFGRGYGEEVDWCQRARALGGQHLGLPGLFVEHRGGTSFGNTEKLALVAKNNDIVAGRYPDYDREVQEFIAADPLITARLALALAWAGSFGQEIPVYVAHSLGGGADNYLENRIETEIKATGRPSVILRVGGPVRWQVEVVSESGRVAGTTTDFGFLKELLRPLKARRMIYSCGVGDPDPIALPDRIIELCTSPNHKIDVLFHDFFPISPSYTLLDSKHRYLGPVTPKTTPDPAHRLQRPSGDLVDLPEWQKAWGRLMSSADRIVVFSEDSRHQVTTSYPQTKDRITLIPHEMLAAVPRVQAPTGRRVVAVLGNIGVQKGAGLLQDMARELGDDPDLGLALIGNIDPAYALPTHVPVHGNYAISDIAALVAQYGVTDWLVPSIWPETFCYTVHEALATGLPVYAFDIGAQGEAVRAAENGRPLAYDPDRPLAGEILAAFTCAQEAS